MPAWDLQANALLMVAVRVPLDGVTDPWASAQGPFNGQVLRPSGGYISEFPRFVLAYGDVESLGLSNINELLPPDAGAGLFASWVMIPDITLSFAAQYYEILWFSPHYDGAAVGDNPDVLFLNAAPQVWQGLGP